MAAQNVPAAAPLFGHLIPLGSEHNDTLPQKNSTTQLLSLPGSFGRAELLESYAKKKCSNCRHIKKEVEEKYKNPAAAVIGLCQFCQSIQYVAKFIPRKDFLNFSYHGGSKEQQHRQLVLTVSAGNTAKLVRVSSERPNYNNNKVSEKKTEDGVVRMVVNDGDLVSICWYQTSNGSTTSKELKPLIQFRVFKCLETSDSILTKDDDVAVQKNPIGQASILDGDYLKASSGCSNESHLHAINTCNNDQVGLINMKNEGTKSNNCNENESQESSEEEEESAPLSLPSKFLASSSKSYSFDSQLLSASPSKAALNAATESCSSSLKRKTPPQTGDATNSSFTTTKTPKKSNVRAPNCGVSDRATDKESAPLSSLSYDELLQLRDQSTTSLRQNVLSLALALSSNASAYDSNFMKEVQDFRTPAKTRQNQTAHDGSGKMNGDSKNSAGAKANPRQWMPRLLQGTEIVLNKKSSDKK